jgi:hypothetical protein
MFESKKFSVRSGKLLDPNSLGVKSFTPRYNTVANGVVGTSTVTVICRPTGDRIDYHELYVTPQGVTFYFAPVHKGCAQSVDVWELRVI